MQYSRLIGIDTYNYNFISIWIARQLPPSLEI